MNARKTLEKIFCFAIGATLSISCLAACASAYPYSETKSPLQYEAEYDAYSYRPRSHVYRFDRRVETDGVVFYYESDMNGRTVDSGIDKVKSVLGFCEVSTPVYLSELAASHLNSEEFWVNPKDSAEFIAAVWLAGADGEELPFGVYAGAAAYFSGKSAFSVLSEKQLEKHIEKRPYCAELQYPLYTRDYASREERNAAWSLSLSLARDYFGNHTLGDLLDCDTLALSSLFEAHGAQLPDYTFRVADTAFPIKIETKNFHYFFSADFRDRTYFKEFTYTYPVLKDFAAENEQYLRETNAYFGETDFSRPIDVYFGNHFTEITVSGITFPTENNIVCNTVASFAHEANHMILYHARYASGFILEEALANYFGYLSDHAPWQKKVLYWDYRLRNYRDLLYEEAGLKADLMNGERRAVRDIYNRRFGKATEETFRPLDYILCISGYDLDNVESLDGLYVYSPHRVAFIHYLRTTYGMDGLMNVVRHWENATIGEKTFDDLFLEWKNWVRENYT